MLFAGSAVRSSLGVDRVPDQVQKDLKQLHPISDNLRNPFVQFEAERHMMLVDRALFYVSGFPSPR
jgi:hypothetical protein